MAFLTSSTAQLRRRDATQPPVNVSLSSELMEHYQAGFPVDARNRIAAVQDADGNPMIFSVSSDPDSSDRRLYLIMHQAGGPTGWAQFDLSGALGAGLRAQVFGVSQSLNGDIHLALAAEDPASPGVSRLFLTAPLPNVTGGPSRIDWGAFGAQWVERTHPQGGLLVTEILAGTSDDLSGPPALVVATEAAGQDAQHYVVNGDLSDSSWLWHLLPSPQDADQIVDLVVGNQPENGRGVYTLYRLRDSAGLGLRFTTFEDPLYEVTVDVPLAVPPGAAALAALPRPADGGTDLYVAGDGLFVFPSGAQQQDARWQTIYDGGSVPDVREFAVCQDRAGGVAIWALSQEDVKYTVKSGAGAGWSPPFTLRADVGQIAPLRNQRLVANEVFLVGNDNGLSHLWQDPATTVWKEATIPLHDTGQTYKFNCYATLLALTDSGGRPLWDMELSVNSSSWAYVTVNGETHLLDGRNPVKIKPDAQGKLTILNKVNSISTPVFNLTADALADTLHVNPAANVREVLRDIKKDDLLGATVSDGGQLLEGDSRKDDNAQTAADALNQLVQLSDTLPADGSSQGAPGGGASRLPAGYGWGVEFGPDGAKFHDAESVRANLLPRYARAATRAPGPISPNFPEAIEVNAGDILDNLEHGFKKAKHFYTQAAGDFVDFFVDLGDGELLKFTLKALESAFKAINWLSKELLGIDLSKWLKWLGFVFEWEDIKTTHKVLVNVANQTLDYAKSKIEGFEPVVNDFFQKLEGRLRSLVPASPAAGGRSLKPLCDSIMSANPHVKNFWANNPVGDFGNYQIFYGGVLGMDSGSSSHADPMAVAMQDFLRIVESAAEGLFDTTRQLFEDLKQAYDDGSLTPNQLIEKMGGDLIIGLLETARKVFISVLEFAADLVGLIKDVLNEEIKIPFLSAFFGDTLGELYEDLAGSKMSVLDGLMLLFAIPTTALYKTVKKRSPFSHGTHGLDTMRYRELFATLGGAAHAPAVAAPALTAARASDKAEGGAAREKSSTASEAAKLYAEIGGVCYSGLSFAYEVMNVFQLMSDEGLDQGGGESQSLLPSGAKKIDPLARVNFFLTLGKLAVSFPVGSADDKAGLNAERAYWVFVGLGVVKEGVTAVADILVPKDTGVGGAKMKGTVEIMLGLCELGLTGWIFADELLGEEDATAAGVKMFNNLLDSLSDGLGGLARLDYEKETKTDLAAGAMVTGTLSAVLNGLRVFIDDMSFDGVHYNF